MVNVVMPSLGRLLASDFALAPIREKWYKGTFFQQEILPKLSFFEI
jgi:hypothetical protein